MFAAQLLRILQTIPSDVESETCVDNSAEQDMTMKENQDETLDGSKSFGSEVDPLEFDSKEVYDINGLRSETHPSPFELKGKDECWNPFVDFSIDNQKVSIDSGGEEFQSAIFGRLSSSEKDEYLLSSVTNAEDKETESKEFAASNPFEKDSNLFDDEIGLGCEHPELIVCYKEVNYHVVKDICIDEGMPLNSDFLTHSSKDDQSDHGNATEAVHEEFLISDVLAEASLENTKDNIANEHGSEEEEEEECQDILLSEGRPKSPDKESSKDSDEKDSLQNDKSVTHASMESFVDSSLPIQEFGTRSFLRSFLNSLDDEALPDQISSGKVVSEGCTETEAKEDIQPNNLRYNSKVETGSITFNFKPPEPVLDGITYVGPENINEQSVDSSDSLSSKDTTNENAHDHKNLDSKDENPVLSPRGEVVNSHEHRDSENEAVASFRRYDDGEMSFSASGVISCSGPIAFSGNLSDGSASCVNSGRSFAFPILQNEWSTSPVKMTKGKHRGWRSGLLCCRFRRFSAS